MVTAMLLMVALNSSDKAHHEQHQRDASPACATLHGDRGGAGEREAEEPNQTAADRAESREVVACLPGSPCSAAKQSRSLVPRPATK